MGLDSHEAVPPDRDFNGLLKTAEELAIGAARFQEFLEERIHLEEPEFWTGGQIEDRIADREIRVHDGADDPGVLVEHLRVTGQSRRLRPAVPFGGHRLQRGLAAEELRELADQRQYDAHMGKMAEKLVRGAPEFALGYAGDGDIGDAVEEFPGEPDRLDRRLFGFENVGMVVDDGAVRETGHGKPPLVWRNQFLRALENKKYLD